MTNLPKWVQVLTGSMLRFVILALEREAGSWEQLGSSWGFLLDALFGAIAPS